MLYELNRCITRYGNRTVLDIDHLIIEPCRIYALIGANGAGKTTLLNQLAFLDQPSSGVVIFRGRPIRYGRTDLTALRRSVVLVDQSPIMFSGSVRDNVEFGLKVRNIPKKEREYKVERALTRVGMSGFAGADAQELSGGEIKRAALARALVFDPEVLLCDEPTANVDRRHREVIMEILEYANCARQTSVIFSTHHLSQSRRIAHQTLFLQDGKPAYHAEENCFRGTVSFDAAGRRFFRPIGGPHIRIADASRRGGDGDDLYVHILPEKISTAPLPSGGPRSSEIIGWVKAITWEEDAIRLVVDIGVPVHVLVDVARFEREPIRIRQQVRVSIPIEAVIEIESA